MEMENGITGKCEEVCLAVTIESLGAKKDGERGKLRCCILSGNCELVFLVSLTLLMLSFLLWLSGVYGIDGMLIA